MVSFMHHWALKIFIKSAEKLGSDEDIKKYTEMADKVKKACEDVLWDGEWYLRGFTNKGYNSNTWKESRLMHRHQHLFI